MIQRRAGTYTSLGWSWRLVGGSGLLHLVPGTILRLSRTACQRSLAGVAVTEPLQLTGDDEKCVTCRRANGDV